MFYIDGEGVTVLRWLYHVWRMPDPFVSTALMEGTAGKPESFLAIKLVELYKFLVYTYPVEE